MKSRCHSKSSRQSLEKSTMVCSGGDSRNGAIPASNAILTMHSEFLVCRNVVVSIHEVHSKPFVAPILVEERMKTIVQQKKLSPRGESRLKGLNAALQEDSSVTTNELVLTVSVWTACCCHIACWEATLSTTELQLWPKDTSRG